MDEKARLVYMLPTRGTLGFRYVGPTDTCRLKMKGWGDTWVAQFSVQLLISAQDMIPGSWV